VEGERKKPTRGKRKGRGTKSGNFFIFYQSNCELIPSSPLSAAGEGTRQKKRKRRKKGEERKNI